MVWFKRSLSAQEALARANKHLEKAGKTKDKRKVLGLCVDAKEALGKVDVASVSIKDRNEIASTYRKQGTLLKTFGLDAEAKINDDKANELSSNTSPGTSVHPPASPSIPQQSIAPSSELSTDHPKTQDSTMSLINGTILGGKKEPVLANIFTKDCPPPSVEYKLPEQDERLVCSRQLTLCLALLQTTSLPLDSLGPKVRTWLQSAKKNQEEKDRLAGLAKELIRAFVRDELKDMTAVAEVVILTPVLGKSELQSLLSLLANAIKDNLLQNSPALEGLAHLIHGATPGTIEADDFVKVLDLVSTRLQATFQQSPQYIYESTFTISRVLDAMADSNIKGLDRDKVREPLLLYLRHLKADKDPYMVYQAAYAYQALLRVPDEEEPWQAALRRSGIIINGVGGLVSAIKGLNVAEFINGLSTIQEGLQGAAQVFELVQDAYNGVTALMESGQGLLESLKSGLSFSRKRAWYAVLRGADSLILNGEMRKFKTLVCEAPCRGDLAFQWGLCQRLGYLAADPMRDEDSRKGAIAFLGEIYRNDKEWGQEAQIKQCILDILLQLSRAPECSSEGSMKTATENLLSDLSRDGDEKKRDLYLACIKAGPSPHSWKVATPLPHSTSLIDLVQNKPSVRPALRTFKLRRLQEQEQRRNPVYIQPQAKATRRSSNDDLFDLTIRINEFIHGDGDCKVFLLLGDSGAGKSTFNLELERNLWESYETDEKWIPVFVPLPSIANPEKDLIVKQLGLYYAFTDAQIHELKSHYQFVLICDGYDECQTTNNLYIHNRLHLPGEWKVKMVISCRSEFLGSDYHVRFQPGDRNDRRGAMQLQEAVVAPFSVAKISEYIRSYVKNNQSGDALWTIDDYERAIKTIPKLQELVSNPFLLSLALKVLPQLVDLSEDLTTSRISRFTLYDRFVENWVEEGQSRITKRKLTESSYEAYETLSYPSFFKSAIEFMTKLAVAMFDNQDGKPVVDFSSRDKGNWKAEFFDRSDRRNILLFEACPLKRTGNKYKFIHRSILEYGLARAVYAASLSSDDSGGSVEHSDEEEETDMEEPSDDATYGSPLFRKSFVHEPSIISFLSERVQQNVDFKCQLHQFIDRSKTDERFSQAAANAITILVRAGVQFNGEDLRGIRVPGADLSYGDFDSAQLQGADLTKTILKNVWLHQATLSGARMEGVMFGEYPNLEMEDLVKYCVFSPDGKYLTVGLQNGAIGRYDTSTWNKILFPRHTHGVANVESSSRGEQVTSCGDDKSVQLWDMQDGALTSSSDGHRHVTSMAYSPSGRQIISGSLDDTVVRLWDVQTGALVSSLDGHTGKVSAVAFSPSGLQIASGSWDMTVRLWDIKTGALVSSLSGHSSFVTSVAYSPEGHRIASSSVDKTVRLWDSQTGALIFSLRGHTDTISSVAYSPTGRQIASGSWDKTVLLWDAETGALISSLGGIAGIPTSVTYSPKGHQISAGCMDDTVRQWDSRTGAPVSTLSGHTETIDSVAYLPTDGHLIASGGKDKTVRLWDAQAEALSSSLSGHAGVVSSVAYSLGVDQIVSGSWDFTLRLWDSETGALISTMSGHPRNIHSVAYSPSGHQIASGCQDKIVRLWDAKTGALNFSLAGHKSDVNSVAYSPIHHEIASGSSDKTVRLWDTQTGAYVSSLIGHTTEVTSVVYSPSGHQIASGSWDMTVRLWDAKTGVLISTLTGHESGVLSVAFSPGGNQIASGSDDRTVRLWDTHTGELSVSLNGHTKEINSVAYSPSGHMIASGSDDDTVRLWDVITGQCLFTLDGFQDIPNGIAWTKDSLDGTCAYLVVGGKAKSVRTWKVIGNGEQLKVRLQWRSTSDKLVLLKASVQGVQDLSELNLRLLQQRGAEGQPIAL